MKPSTAIIAGACMLSAGGYFLMYAVSPKLQLAGLGLLVLGAGFALGGILSRKGDR